MPRTIETTVYTIEEHPNPESVYEWIRNNWHDLGEHVVEEFVESLNGFASHIGARCNYSISIVPDMGEFIRFDIERSLSDVMESLDLAGNCPFTGVYSDEIILDAFRRASKEDNLHDILRDVEYRVLKAIHGEVEFIYSDEGLYEFCLCNEHEFTESGKIA